MKNMKALLRLLGAVSLSTVAASSLVACGEKETPTPSTSDTKIDISTKITSPIDLGQLDANTKADFLAKLQKELVKIADLNTITNSDYDVYKAGTTTSIQDSDVTKNNAGLNIKIVAKETKFKGNKDNITVNYTKKLDNLDNIITDKNLGTINIPESIINDVDQSKKEILILSYLRSNNKNDNLRTLGVDISDVIINAQNKGTAKVKSNIENYYNGNVDISFTVSKEKIDLNKLVIDWHLSLNPDTSKTMKELDISKIFKIFNKIKLTNPTIEYQDAKGKNIDDEIQQKGNFQVKITANSNDPNYSSGIVIYKILV